MSNINNPQSPFELRYGILHRLISISPDELNTLNNNLGVIAALSTEFDSIISGKRKNNNPIVNQFKSYVSKCSVLSPHIGPVEVEYRTWYDREFLRLYNNITDDNNEPVIHMELSFSRQIGISVFLILYCGFMKTKGYNVGLHSYFPIHDIAISNKPIDVTTIKSVANSTISNSIDQLILDNIGDMKNITYSSGSIIQYYNM